MNYATKSYLSKLFLISLVSTLSFIYIQSVFNINFVTLSSFFALFNTLLATYYYSFLFVERKEKLMLSLPIKKSILLFAPILAIYAQSFLFDLNFLGQLDNYTAFIIFNKYLVPTLALMFLTSSSSILSNAISIILLALFSLSTINGLEFLLNNLTFVNLSSNHPLSLISLFLVMALALLLTYKTYNIYLSQHNSRKLETYFYFELIVFITVTFQKLFIIKQPFQTFFSTVNFMNYQIVWVNILIAIILILFLIKYLYGRLNKFIVILYLLPLLIISSLYISFDKLLDQSKLGCEMLSRINHSENNTIWFNNVPLISYSDNLNNSIVDVNRDYIQRCMNTQEVGSDVMYFGINYNYLKDNHLDVLVKNNVMYLIDDTFDLGSLYTLYGQITGIALFNYSDFVSDHSRDYLFVILPQQLDWLQPSIEEVVHAMYPNSDLTFIQDDNQLHILSDILGYYNMANRFSPGSDFGNLQVSMISLTGSRNDLEYANILLSKEELFRVPSLRKE